MNIRMQHSYAEEVQNGQAAVYRLGRVIAVGHGVTQGMADFLLTHGPVGVGEPYAIETEEPADDRADQAATPDGRQGSERIE